MDDSGTILCQISSLKDMLDHVNEEIEASIQITREVESEIVKCTEIEAALAVREAELMKMVYEAEFEIDGLMAVTVDSRASVKLLEEELCFLRMKHDEILKRINKQREGFTISCLDFQRSIDKEDNGELGALLSEKELLENEVHLLTRRNRALQNSTMAFMEEILEDLCSSNSAILVDIQSGNLENEKLLKGIDELKTTLLSAISIG